MVGDVVVVVVGVEVGVVVEVEVGVVVGVEVGVVVGVVVGVGVEVGVVVEVEVGVVVEVVVTMNPLVVFLGILTITSYQSLPEQTKGKGAYLADCYYTSIGHRVSEDGCAVSQDLLQSGRVHYGDVIFVEGLKPRIVNDTMNPRLKNSIDFWVNDLEEERNFGVKHRRVWVIRGSTAQLLTAAPKVLP